MAGCAGLKSLRNPVFPKSFTGTWERVDQSISKHTLEITSTTIKASNHVSHWDITLISGTEYTISHSINPNLTGTISLKRSGKNLEIIEAYDMSNIILWRGTEDDWSGIWKKR